MTSLAHVHGDLSRSGVTLAPYEQALFGELEAAIDHYNAAPQTLIQILHRAQELFGYLREDVVAHVARRMRLPISHVHGVIGFYSFFSRVPPGKHAIQVCLGTPCYVQGAAQLLRGLEKELGIQPGQTTPDGRFSLRCVRCLGACGQHAVVTIGHDVVHERLKSDGIKETLRHYR
jgi:NADH:ubiquinone oxidoreductase subunit E